MRFRRFPLYASATFYAVALFAVALPQLVRASGAEGVAWLLFTATIGLYGVLTLLALNHRPDDRRVTLFMFTGFAVALTILFETVNVAHGVTFESIAFRFAFLVVFLMNFAVVLHMASVTPRQNPFTARHRWVIPSAYVVGGVAVVVSLALYINAFTGWLPWATPRPLVSSIVQLFNIVLYGIAGVGALALVGYTARFDEIVEHRRQAVIVFCGIFPWTVHALATPFFPEFVQSAAGLIVSAVVILLVPIAFVISILRYKLFEVGLLAREVLVYGLTIAAVGAAVVGISPLIVRFISVVLGLDSSVAYVILAFLAGIAFHPLASRMTLAVDRRFFTEKLHLREFEQSVISELAGFRNPAESADYLVRRICHTLHIRNAALFLADEQRDFYRVAAAAGDFDDEDAARAVVIASQDLMQWSNLLSKGYPFPRGEERAERGQLAPMLDLIEAEHIVPIKLKERLIGLMTLGEPLKGWQLDRQDVDRLFTIARQASAMIDNARLADLAMNDALTQLPRRAPVVDRLQLEIRRARRTFHPFAVAMIDVDSFKEVNDTYGHIIGDKVLREIARLLVTNSRRVDVIGRYGGDEFIAIFPDTTASGAILHASQLCRDVASTQLQIENQQVLSVQVSIGVCVVAHPVDLEEATELVRRADEALYQAKRDGKNRVALFETLPQLKTISIRSAAADR